MKIVRFDELQAVPWKNGLGITRELAVDPPGATMDDFRWRVSIADVDTASPFSRFAGIDRTIVLLDGDGFTMTLDGEREHALTKPCVPFAFPGEAQVDIALAGSATRDFNLMVRRGAARGSIDVVSAAGMQDCTGAVLAYIARGNATIDGTPCNKGDTALHPSSLTLGTDATILLVRIARPPM